MDEEKAGQAAVEKRHSELVLENRALEGELADFNLALDKLRNQQRPEDVLVQFQQSKSHNEELRREVRFGEYMG